MTRALLLALGLAFLSGSVTAVAAPGIKAKEGESDLKKLEGDWAIESWVQFGQPVALKADWSFKGEKYTLDQPTNVEEGTFKLDPKKSPGTIDLTITGGNCKGNDQPGIYKIEDDTLSLCLAWPGQTDRPTEFVSTADKRWILVTLKRKK